MADDFARWAATETAATLTHDTPAPECARPGCGEPVTGTPVTGPGDPLGRKWCSEECLTATAEGWAEQHYAYGVAT